VSSGQWAGFGELSTGVRGAEGWQWCGLGRFRLFYCRDAAGALQPAGVTRSREAAKPRREWRGAGGELPHPCRIRGWLSAAFVARAFQPEHCAYEHSVSARPQGRMTAVILNHEWARTDTILSRITVQMGIAADRVW